MFLYASLISGRGECTHDCLGPATQLCPRLPDSKATWFSSEPVHVLLWLLNLLCTYPGLCQQNMPLLSAASSFSPQPMCITLTYHPRGPHHLSTVLAPPVVPGHCPSPVAFFTSLFWGCQTAEGLLPTSAQRNYHVFIMLGCCYSFYKAHSFMFSMYLHAHVWNLYGYWPPFFLFLVESPTAPPSALEKWDRAQHSLHVGI